MGDNKSSSQAVTFDLSAQAGVMQALYAVRTSDLGNSDKNDLRDQIFAYTKSGDDRTREQIEAKLDEIPLAQAFLDVYQTKPKEQAKPGFALGRRAPSFSVPVAPPIPKADTPSSETSPGLKSPKEAASVKAAPEQQPAEKTPAQPEPASSTQPASISNPAPAPKQAPKSSQQQASQSFTPARLSVESSSPPATTETATSPKNTPQSQPAGTATTSAAPSPSPAASKTTLASQAEPLQSEMGQQTEPAATSSAPQPAPTPDPEPTGAANAEAYSIQRIREIKRYINNKIGNPVNLVDIDNELGRSYMSALLAAMQSVNAETGRAGANEMQDLESVFQKVQPLLQEGGKTSDDAPATAQPPKEPVPGTKLPSTPKPISASTPHPTQGQEVKTDSQSQSAEPAKAVGTSDSVAATPEPVVSQEQPATPPEPVASAHTQPTTSPAEPVVPTSSPAQKFPAASQVTSVPSVAAEAGNAPVAETHTPMPAVNADDGEADDKRDDAVPMPTESATPPEPVRPPLGIGEVPSKASPRDDASDNVPGVPSPQSASSQYAVDQETANSLANQLSELDKKAAAANEHHGDPLHEPEIDAGLEQLLQEWNIFKSSGLFGTGPNGREHPLYKKLASVMIQDVAQGRFDDARPEVTQSITDYMNGWRYEQGIVYEPGETFETYLRRVIRFIIDSKK